jgi:hypothetical protein
MIVRPQQKQLTTPPVILVHPAPPPLDARKEAAWLGDMIAQYQEPTARLMLITPAMAQAMVERAAFNRKVTDSWVGRLSTIMVEGRWHIIPSGPAFDTNGHLRDAQHRLRSIIKSGKSVHMFVFFGLSPKAFDAIDVGLKRSASQMLARDGIPYTSLLPAVVRMMHRLDNGGAAFDEQGVALTAKEMWEESDILGEAVRAAYLVQDFGAISASVVAYHRIVTRSTHAARLGEFWEKLAHGHDLPADSPILAVRAFLRGKPPGQRAGEWTQGRSKKHPFGQYQAATSHAAYIIQAWVAWAGDVPRSKFVWKAANALPEVNP